MRCPTLTPVALCDQQLGVVGVHGQQIALVLDDHQVAVPADAAARVDHLAVGRRVHRRPDRRRQIDPFVLRPARVPKGEPTAARSIGPPEAPRPGATATLASEGGGRLAGGGARPAVAGGGATAGAAPGGEEIGPRPAST